VEKGVRIISLTLREGRRRAWRRTRRESRRNLRRGCQKRAELEKGVRIISLTLREGRRRALRRRDVCQKREPAQRQRGIWKRETCSRDGIHIHQMISRVLGPLCTDTTLPYLFPSLAGSPPLACTAARS
jgi:hypothetical protein